MALLGLVGSTARVWLRCASKFDWLGGLLRMSGPQTVLSVFPAGREGLALAGGCPAIARRAATANSAENRESVSSRRRKIIGRTLSEHYWLFGVSQPGKKVLATILEACPLVTVLYGRK